MTEASVVHTRLTAAGAAGAALGEEISQALHGNAPDALILFASPKYNFPSLLRSLDAACKPKVLVGCSSAGEFTGAGSSESSACAIAIRSPEMEFTAALGRNMRTNRTAAASAIVSGFRRSTDYRYHSAMVLTDALAGYSDNLIEQINLLTGGTYQLFGGGAGDDANFGKTHVFSGIEVVEDAAVALEILSNKPLGIGVHHGWVPAGPAMRVTESEGMRLISLNATSALEMFERHARDTEQNFNPGAPIPFFLQNVLGIHSRGGYKLRVPLHANADGSITCAADVPAGSTVHIMKTSAASAIQAATKATEAALEQLGENRPKVAIFFDCVATRLRIGQDFGFELSSVQKSLGAAKFAGCNTYGQIARADRQFDGFHNCTAVIGVLPE